MKTWMQTPRPTQARRPQARTRLRFGCFVLTIALYFAAKALYARFQTWA